MASARTEECTDANEREADAWTVQKLGEEVATGLINVFNEMEAAHRSEFQELRHDIARLETRLVEFRADLKQDITVVRSELKQDIAGLRSELKQDIAAGLSEQIKWSFVFWLGTIGIVMLLLRYFGETA